MANSDDDNFSSPLPPTREEDLLKLYEIVGECVKEAIGDLCYLKEDKETIREVIEKHIKEHHIAPMKTHQRIDLLLKKNQAMEDLKSNIERQKALQISFNKPSTWGRKSNPVKIALNAKLQTVMDTIQSLSAPLGSSPPKSNNSKSWVNRFINLFKVQWGNSLFGRVFTGTYTGDYKTKKIITDSKRIIENIKELKSKVDRSPIFNKEKKYYQTQLKEVREKLINNLEEYYQRIEIIDPSNANFAHDVICEKINKTLQEINKQFKNLEKEMDESIKKSKNPIKSSSYTGISSYTGVNLEMSSIKKSTTEETEADRLRELIKKRSVKKPPRTKSTANNKGKNQSIGEASLPNENTNQASAGQSFKRIS